MLMMMMRVGAMNVESLGLDEPKTAGETNKRSNGLKQRVVKIISTLSSPSPFRKYIFIDTVSVNVSSRRYIISRMKKSGKLSPTPIREKAEKTVAREKKKENRKKSK